MSQKIKEILIILFFILAVTGIYLFASNMNFSFMENESGFRKFTLGALIIFVLILLALVVNYFKNMSKKKEIKYRDKLFNSLVKNSDTVYFMYDSNQKEVIYMSKNMTDVLGIQDKESTIVLKEILEIPVLKAELKEWDGNKEFVSQMILYQNQAYQHQRWIKVKIYPYKDKKLEYHVILISDVTKEHDKQHLLVSQATDIKIREQKLNQITAMSYDIEIDLNLTTSKATLNNLKDVKLLGVNRSCNYNDLIDSIKNDYISSSDSNSFFKQFSVDKLNSLFDNKNLEPISIRYKLKDEKTWLESTAFLSFQRGEKIVTILTEDVTENAEYVKKQNVILQTALKEAEKANKSKTNFLSTVSHEIRSSMNAILGLSESILNADLNEEIKEDVIDINNASENILEVIDDMLDISKVENGVLELKEKNYNVVKLFKDVINVGKQNIDKANVKLSLDINKSVPLNLYGDSSKIRQILLNIMNNSIENTKKGSISLSVNAVKRTTDIDLCIKLEDTGIGMEESVVNNLFNNKLDINLSIVKNLIDLLKGTISVESTLSKGTIYELHIFQRFNDDAIVGEIEKQKIVKKKTNLYKYDNKKILIVDDNKLDQRVAMRLLKETNIKIECVDSGIECIDLIKSGMNYDLILLDQMMPNMDGIETFKELKKIYGFNIKTIMLTADAMVGKKEQYLKVGLDGYLSKPIIIEELNTMLKKYLDKEV